MFTEAIDFYADAPEESPPAGRSRECKVERWSSGGCRVLSTHIPAEKKPAPRSHTRRKQRRHNGFANTKEQVCCGFFFTSSKPSHALLFCPAAGASDIYLTADSLTTCRCRSPATEKQRCFSLLEHRSVTGLLMPRERARPVASSKVNICRNYTKETANWRVMVRDNDAI